MIDYEDRDIVFHCDAKRCAAVLETETEIWEEALKELEVAGWSARHSGHCWLHTCDSCLEAENGLAL